MKISLIHQPATPTSASPYRLVDLQGQEITWANEFLDAQRLRQLSLRSLRAYGYDLLHFARWWLQRPSPDLLHMNESTLVDYVREQLNEEPKPTPQTINHRLGVLRCLYRFHTGHSLSPGSNHFQSHYVTRSSLGYLSGLRRLLRDFASEGHVLQAGLLLPEDFRSRPPLPPKPRHPLHRRPLQRHSSPPLPHPIFGKIFEDLIQTLATTLSPSTILAYRTVSRSFLSYLQTDFPEVRQLSELRRNPHMFGWFRRLCQKPPLLANLTRVHWLCLLRRLLRDLASQGYALQPELILRQDFPQCPSYLPRALSPEHDRRLQEELRRSNDLLSNALLLTRATGIRIGECMDLVEDCLRSVGPDQWALHVPLGKLHTERLVPVDQDTRQLVTHILALREQVPSFHLSRSIGLLLPRSGVRRTLYRALCGTLKAAAARAGCSPVRCHQLRHTYASEMIRLGISLPALMQLLGHKDIRMTMRYVQVTQLDLQREFHQARHHAVNQHQIPQLSRISSGLSTTSDVPGIRATVRLAHHLLEMYRRQIQDERARKKVHRLDKRLLRVALELDRLPGLEK